MEESHSRIVEGAARLLRERGLESASVADVMSDAGLTHGGFYRHFPNKEAMAVAALQLAFEQIASTLETKLDKGDPNSAVESFRNQYLSKQHLENPGQGCPIAALGSDIARASDELRSAFGAGTERIIQNLAQGMTGPETARYAKAVQELAMLVGAVIIARASDSATARRILSACRAL